MSLINLQQILSAMTQLQKKSKIAKVLSRNYMSQTFTIWIKMIRQPSVVRIIALPD